jgi:asparagine synthase (glutamine-hydrolysing)
MFSADGRYVIVFNGEIYNYREIRSTLERDCGIRNWRGHSDTEVMLAAISHWGIRQALECFNGMFGFALWDRAENTLYLARDRLGEKPLYYGWMGKTFLFGSELKALRTHPAWRGEIDRDVLTLYLRHSYVPAPHSIYKSIYKLRPGCLLTLPMNADRCGSSRGYEVQSYWSAKETAEKGIATPFDGTDRDAIEVLDELLGNAVAMRMEADVPLGAFLSGGIDSSTIVALMQAQSDQPVRTFSIGFHEHGYNEAVHAKAVAKYLGTAHTELYVTPQQAMAVIPKLPGLYDEPFSDVSQIPTYLVSDMTRKHVTVSLSGDGGDELFGGYNRYFWGRSIWKKFGWAPAGFRRLLAQGLVSVSPGSWDRCFHHCSRVVPGKPAQRLPGDKIHKLATILAVDSPQAMYRRLVSHWLETEAVVIQGKEPSSTLTDPDEWASFPDFTQWMMFLDTITYLPDDILTKVDRASMGVSLESRIPMLDHRVVEFSWTIPLSMKIRNGQGKWLLRQVLNSYVPQKLMERPKMGFGVPIGIWLRGPLRDWAEALLDEERLVREGFFNPAPIRSKWREHLTGARNWQDYLWDILMFQTWLSEQSIQ